MTWPGPLLSAALSLASPAGRRARLAILIYHRVLPAYDPLLTGVPDRAMFDWQMSLMARHFNVLPLPEAGRLLQEGRLPARAACITFDDGYADNLTEAWPVLRRHGIPATFFVATGYLDGGRMFNDTLIELVRRLPGEPLDLGEYGIGEVRLESTEARRSLVSQLIKAFKYLPMTERQQAADKLADRFGLALPDDLMLSSAQLRELHAQPGVTIGGHTRNHPILRTLAPDDARAEILGGKHDLESLLGAPIEVFAYPNGRPGQDYAMEHVGMVRDCGFALAVSTVSAAAGAGSDPFQLPRFTPWDRTPLRFGLRMLATLASRPG